MEKLSILLNITQTTILATPMKKINNIIKCSKNSKNWHGDIMCVYKLDIKILNHFNSSGCTFVVLERFKF